MEDDRALVPTRRARALEKIPVLGTLAAMVRYVAHPGAPLAGKLILAGAVAYLVLPIDLVPDVAPVVGWLDDLGVVGVAWALFKRYLRQWEVEPALLDER